MYRRNAVWISVLGAVLVCFVHQASAQDDPLPAGAVSLLGTLRWRHATGVYFVAITPDNKAVLTASGDHVFRLWDCQTGKEIRRFESSSVKKSFRPHPFRFYSGFGPDDSGSSCVTVTPDGKTLAALLPNDVIQLWDVETGKELRQFKNTQGVVRTIRFSRSGKFLAVRGTCQEIALIDSETGQQRHVKMDPKDGKVSPGAASGMAFSPDEAIFANGRTGSDQVKITNFMQLIDVRTGDEIRRFDAPKCCASVAFSPDGSVLAYSCLDIIHLRETKSGKEIRQIRAPEMIGSLVFYPEGKQIVAKSLDRAIRVWNVESGNQTDEWGDKLAFTEKRPHGASEECDLAVSADGRIVAWGDGQAVRLWDTVARKDLIAPIGHRAAVTGLGISKDGKTLVSHGEDGALRRWDLVSDKQLQNLPMPAGTTIAAIAPNCDIAALANADGTIRIIDMTTGKERRQHKGHVRPNPDRLNETVDLRFSPDGNILATQGSFDCTIRLHDPVRGAELREIKFGDTASPDRFREFVVRGGMGLAFSADGQTVGACETRTPGRGPYAEEGWYTAKIRQWDVVTGKELRSIALDGRCLITQIVYSPDGRLLAALQSDQTVRLYETATASLRAVLGKPRPSQLSTAWNYQPRYEPAPSRSLTFSRDGRILLSPAPMDTLRVWDVHAAKEIGACKGHEGAILAALFTSDGKRIVTASNDTTMLVWDATRWKHAAIAVADIAPRELESCWSDLAGEDAAKAFASMQKLRSAPKQSVTFLSERLKPVAGPDARRIDRLIADLDSSDFRARTQAGKELEGMGEPALAALKKAHASDLSPEVRRRIASLLEKLTPIALGADDVRLVRGVEILERMGTPEARRVLAGLAKGAPGVLATQQAQMALDRLENR